MSIWFKHDAHFHEHPKALRMRRLAGSKADSAEVGWWRIVAAAKRVGDWSFDDEDHLRDAAGRYYQYVGIYRQAGMLDDLTIHNGAEYQGAATPAERVANHRARNAAAVTPAVTDVTPRVEKSREERVELSNARERLPGDDGRADLEAYVLIHRRAPSPRQRQLLDGLLERHDLTGPKWAADIMLRHPDDAIGAVIAADKAWRAERIAEAQAAEKPKPAVRRKASMPTATRELIEHWAAEREKAAAS